MIYSGKYKVTSPYGRRMLNGQPDDHKGIDVVGITDKHVTAVVPGVVLVSQMVTDKRDKTWEWGNYVCVQGEDGRQYYYCHLAERYVVPGQRVERGDHVGLEGNTGYSFGNHCHFEVQENGVAINPAPILGCRNENGTYGRDYRAKVKARFGLSEGSMRHMDGYKYAADLYRKFAEGK